MQDPEDQPQAAQPAPPAATPAPPAENPQGSRWRTRARGVLSRRDTRGAVLATLIAFASILSAVVAWRASLASIDASRYESLAVQQQARVQQIQRELAGLVAQDLRFVNVFQEHALAARELRAQADELRATDPAAADVLDLQAHARLDLARAVEPFFVGATGPELGEDGMAGYDVAHVVQNLEAGHGELRELRTQHTDELAARATAKSVSLIGVAALVVAALFFLTVAQVIRARAALRQVFFAAGAVLVGLGTASFVLVELLA